MPFEIDHFLHTIRRLNRFGLVTHGTNSAHYDPLLKNVESKQMQEWEIQKINMKKKNRLFAIIQNICLEYFVCLLNAFGLGHSLAFQIPQKWMFNFSVIETNDKRSGLDNNCCVWWEKQTTTKFRKLFFFLSFAFSIQKTNGDNKKKCYADIIVVAFYVFSMLPLPRCHHCLAFVIRSYLFAVHT